MKVYTDSSSIGRSSAELLPGKKLLSKRAAVCSLDFLDVEAPYIGGAGQ